MKLSDIEGKRIIILTYLFDSGLYYLGESLYRLLEKKNKVFFFPKEKYKKEGRYYKCFYPKKREIIHADIIDARNPSDIIHACREKNIDIVFSLETFIPSSKWVPRVRDLHNTKVYDVPMPEWTDAKFLKSRAYDKFDKIFCLTETAEKIFGSYKNSERLSWDYAHILDKDLLELNKIKKDHNLFYHQASLNPSFSQKNTENVISAFKSFSKEYKEAKLIITGVLSAKEKELVRKSNNIMNINEILNKKEIFKLYKKAGCLIAPSTREGLGMQFYEAKKMGCDIITTNIDPMNIHSDYLCKVISYNRDNTMVPHALASAEEIERVLKEYYKEVLNEQENKRSN